MKLTIDTEAKTIQIEGSDNLGDVVYKLKRMFPDGEWMDYKLIPAVTFVVQKEHIYINQGNGLLNPSPWIGPGTTPYYHEPFTLTPSYPSTSGEITVEVCDLLYTFDPNNSIVSVDGSNVTNAIFATQPSDLVTLTKN